MGDWDAGWYEDPEHEGQIRYWHGGGWTEFRHPTPENFPLGRPGPDASGEGTRRDSPRPADQGAGRAGTRDEPQDHQPEAPAPEPRVQQQPGPRSEPQPSRPDDTRPGPADPPQRTKSKVPLLVGLGVGGFVVVALLGFALVTGGTFRMATPGSSATLPTPPDGAKASEWGRTYTGSGDGAVRVPSGGERGLVKVSHEGDSNFTVDSVSAENDSTGLLFNAIGETTGTSAYGLGEREATAWLSVETEGRWSLTFKKLETAPEFGESETGSNTKAFAWDSFGGANLAVTWSAPASRESGLIYIDQYGAEDEMEHIVLESGEEYRGTAAIPPGTKYIVVRTDGDWKLTRR